MAFFFGAPSNATAGILAVAKPVVFDPAQFEKSADSDRIVNLLRNTLLRDPATANIGDFANYQLGSIAGLPDSIRLACQS